MNVLKVGITKKYLSCIEIERFIKALLRMNDTYPIVIRFNYKGAYISSCQLNAVLSHPSLGISMQDIRFELHINNDSDFALNDVGNDVVSAMEELDLHGIIIMKGQDIRGINFL